MCATRNPGWRRETCVAAISARRRAATPARTMPFPRSGTPNKRSNPESDPARRPSPPSTSAPTRSGCFRASSNRDASAERVADDCDRLCAPAASSSCSSISALAAMPRAARSSAPHPGRSGAITRWSADNRSASARQSPPAPGWPCTSTTTGPAPESIGAIDPPKAARAPSSLHRDERDGATARATLPPLSRAATLLTPHHVTRASASTTVEVDILDVPSSRSTKRIGTFAHLGAHPDRAVGHLDLKPVAAGPDRAHVDATKDTSPHRP